MQTISSILISDFTTAVWRNYAEMGRCFPWRETSDPYAVMVSEFMLQQTQTNRVVSKYEAWLAHFPDVQSVANAALSEVLLLWNGLGYNRRAKFLHESCRKICAEYGGVLPCDAQLLDALPGIGPYTARAVIAFAFNKAQVFIETNIRSAFIDFFFSDAVSVSDAEILPLIEQTLDRKRPREWYYALMDYGVAVKRKAENPSRRSSSYAKQSKFEGSLRQARGAILRQLSRNGTISLTQIAAAEHIDMERLFSAAQKLVEEQLIRKSGEAYSFC